MLPLVCIDVDGTLVGDSGEPTEAVWAATEAATGRGQHLALCTARLAKGKTLDWARRLDPQGTHLFHNGAALIDLATGSITDAPVPLDAIAEITAAARERSWDIEYYSPTDYTIASDTAMAEGHAGLLGLPFERRAVEELDGPIVRVQFLVPIAEANDAVLSAPIGVEASAATSPVMPDAAFVSMTATGISKGVGIRRIAELLGTTVDQTMMVGDGLNDIEALDVVGHGVAMGNADPLCAAAARYQVGDVSADGLIEALELSATL